MLHFIFLNAPRIFIPGNSSVYSTLLNFLKTTQRSYHCALLFILYSTLFFSEILILKCEFSGEYRNDIIKKAPKIIKRTRKYYSNILNTDVQKLFLSFVCYFQKGLEVSLANVDSCLEKFSQEFGRKYGLPMRKGEYGFCWADFNLKQQRRKWKLILLRELTTLSCTLPGESVAKIVLSNIHTWFILHKRKIKDV